MPQPLEIGDFTSSLFSGLSGFWQRFFRDTEDLQAYYQASEFYLAQAYLDLLGAVLSTGIVDTPVFNKGYWKLFAFSENELSYREGASVAEDRFLYNMPGDAVSVDILQSTIFNPEIVFEREVNFDIENADGYLYFREDPFRQYKDIEGNWYPAQGLAWRWLSIAVGNSFTDVKQAQNWQDNTDIQKGDTLRLLAYRGVLVQEGIIGKLDALGQFKFIATGEAVFDNTHVGDIIQIYDATDSSVIGYYIIKEIGGIDWAYLEETFNATLVTTPANLKWKHYKAIYFTPFVQDYEIDYINSLSLIGNSQTPYPLNYETPYIYAIVRDTADPHVVGATINPYPAITELGNRHLIPGTVRVHAQRMDSYSVRENYDYVVDYLRGAIHPVLYNAPGALIGNDGVITQLGSIARFTSITAIFSDPDDIGGTLSFSTALNPENRHSFIIATRIDANTVELADSSEMISEFPVDWRLTRSIDKPFWSPDPGLTGTGSYDYRKELLFSAGGITTEQAVGTVKQIGLWAPEILEDNFTLYNNFGALLNRFSASSETYKQFLRGIMYLYMSGPILYRVNSAMNVAAGFPVIQSDGEVLQSYEEGIDFQGIDGQIIAGSPSQFVSLSAAFSNMDTGGYLVISKALNDVNNGMFRILNVLDSFTLEIESEYTLVAETPVTWLTSRTYKHKVTTLTPRNLSKVYSYPLYVPMRADIQNSDNFGVLTFSAFDYLTTAFTVTDYLEDPQWWLDKYIPHILWSNTPGARRLATSQLYAHVIGPEDDARIGDPGLYIGADDNRNVYSPTDEHGNPVNIYRHNVAFCLFDRYLKFHMFYVAIHPDVELTQEFRDDLENLVLITKPSYTYPYVEPGDFFEEIVGLLEEFWINMGVHFTGEHADTFEIAKNQLHIGDPFSIGDYFRYIHLEDEPTGIIAPTLVPFVLPIGADERVVMWQLNATIGGNRVLETIDYTIDIDPISPTKWTITPLTNWDPGPVTFDALVIKITNLSAGLPDTRLGFTPLIVGGLSPGYVRKNLLIPEKQEHIDRTLSLHIDVAGMPYIY
jgi:hypothetical protein